MKKILTTVLFLALVSCTSRADIPQDFRFAYDANNNYLGTVESKNDDYVTIRTEKGFIDIIKYNGVPYTKWHDEDLSPADQTWLLYYTTRASDGKTFLIVPEGKTLPANSTFVWGYDPTQSPIRGCITGDLLTLSPEEVNYFLSFHKGLIKGTEYHYYSLNFKATDSKDTYLQYTTGVLTSTVQAYEVVAEGCRTNEEIGYPAPIDEKGFAVAGPLQFKKTKDEVITPL